MKHLWRRILNFVTLWTVLAFLTTIGRGALAVHVPHTKKTSNAGDQDNALSGQEQGGGDVLDYITRNSKESAIADRQSPEGDTDKDTDNSKTDHEGLLAQTYPIPLSLDLADWDSAVLQLEKRYELEEPWPTRNYSDGGEGENMEDNCTHPRQPMPRYNDSCDFVHAECEDKSELIDYLAFVLCDLPKAQPVGYVLMAVWLIYLISLLGTTVDHFFVPPLNYLSDKLRLSPSVAGVTLMALGNGAPDIFVVFSGISQDDLALVLGALTGAAIFITTVVLGTVMLVSKVYPYPIDKIDFMRDIIAFMIVVGTVVGVAFDGAVYLVEACIFPMIYILYIAAVVGIGYFRAWLDRRSRDAEALCNSANIQSCSVTLSSDGAVKIKEIPKNPTISEKLNSMSNVASYALSTSAAEKKPLTVDLKREDSEVEKQDKETEKKVIPYLVGLSWPKGSHWLIKIIWVMHWPFSLLRWLTIPSFYHHGYWSVWHYLLTSLSPLPISILMLIAVKGWSGFLVTVGPLPLPILLITISAVPSILLFILLRPRCPPHWCLQIILVPSAFGMSIIWLNIMANEVVSVMRAFGLLLSIDTAILGLTILALGNCVADWVADTVVTRAGKPEMAFASCFGSPLLSHVLGLSIAMIVKIGFFNHGQPYRFHIQTMAYSSVKLSWIFLGVSLVASAIIFPIFKFSPPRLYGVVLIGLYVVFVVVAILGETHVLPLNL